MNTLLKITKNFPNTKVWNDSCSCAELKYSIENGATGATTNPVIVLNVLKNELPLWEDKIKEFISNNPTSTEDEIAWNVIGALGTEGSKLLLNQYNSSKGQEGRISFQTNAKYYRSYDKMLEQGKLLSKLVPNSQIKAPTSKAGIKVFEELTYLGISINATVSFTTAQAIKVAEAVERGLKRREEVGLPTGFLSPVCTLMIGRLDDYLKGYVKENNININEEALEFAGVSVFKNTYKLYKERNYRTKLLIAAFRNDYHVSEFLGGDLILTIPYKNQLYYNTLNLPMESTINNPVKKEYLEQLLSLTEFKKAYYEEGLKEEEFEHYGAFLITINQFLNGYDDLVRLIRSFIVK